MDTFKSDPWGVAKEMVDGVQRSTSFVVADNHAYSIVMSQPYNSTSIYGRLCMVGNNFYYSKSDLGGSLAFSYPEYYGTFLLFQTR